MEKKELDFKIGLFQITVEDFSKLIKITVEHPTGELWRKEFDDIAIQKIPNNWTTLPFLYDLLDSASQNQDGHSLEVHLQTGESKILSILVKSEPSKYCGARVFSIDLPMIQMDTLEQIKRAVTKLQESKNKSSKEDQFDNVHKHADIVLSRNNLLATKTKASGHLGVVVGKLHDKGVHFLMVKIIRTTVGRSAVMIGVNNSYDVSTYPGNGVNIQGKALYGNTGHIYENGSSIDYGVGGQIPAGSYIGTLLDMNKKEVSMSVNAIWGVPKRLTASAYCFMVTLCDAYETVEIIADECWHKS